MKRMMMLFSAMLASLVASADTWTDPETGIVWTYVVKDGEVCLGGGGCTAVPTSTIGGITIPSSLGGLPVTSIGTQAFWNCTGLTNVVISSSVKSIGIAAFDGCSDLASVTIPEGVANIGQSSFLNCMGLVEVMIPASVESVGDSVFGSCHGLKNINVAVGNVGGYYSSDGILLRRSDTEIELVAYPLGRDSTDAVPDGVTCIRECAFAGSMRLTNVTIPPSVARIERQAFFGCRGLTNVTIPSSVTNIGDGAFSSCAVLKSFTVDEENSNYKTVSGLLLTKDGRTLLAGVNGDVAIPNGVTIVADQAFSLHGGLTGVSFPASVEVIGDNAFQSCSGIKNVTIPENVTNIGWSAFLGCSGLISVKILSHIAQIGAATFSCCSDLVSVVFADERPDLVEDFGRENCYIFSCCDKLSVIQVPNDQKSWDSVEMWQGKKVVHYFSVGTAIRAVPVGGSLILSGNGAMVDYATGDTPWGVEANVFTDIIIDSGISRIGANTFARMGCIGKVTIPASVTSIGDGAFRQCSSLTNVTFLGDAPDTGEAIYEGTPRRLVSYVDNSSIGWAGGVSTDLPDSWNERAIQYFGDGDFAPTRIVWVTNVVTEVRYETREETIFATNYIDVVVTNYVDVGDGEVGRVSDEVLAFEPEEGFDGSQKRTLNGIVLDDDGVFCGLAQIATAKATSRGVTVSGFVMLSDGKKQSLRSVRGAMEGGLLEIKTKVGKIGEMDLVIGANGFRGQIGDLTVVSANPDDESGVLKGSMLLYYFDPKTARLKTKSIKVSGVALEGDASGIIDVRGKEPKSFAAEIE